MVNFLDNVRLNYMVYLFFQRGLLAPSKAWWYITENILEDSSGLNFFNKLKKEYGDFVPVNITGHKLYVVTDVRVVKFMLDNSPNLFSVGKFKYDIFKSFMKFNVGVSTGEMWRKRRSFNQCVLNTDRTHIYLNHYKRYIHKELNNKLPTEIDEFTPIAKKLTMNIVFGFNKVIDDIFEIFGEANNYNVVLVGGQDVDKMKVFLLFTTMLKSLEHGEEHSLIKLSTRCPMYKSNKKWVTELFHQLTHWMFPMVGSFTVHVVRILALIASSPGLQRKIKKDNLLLRKCILENFRLNNAVITTFRSLTKDIKMKGKDFKAGDQFFILNAGFLRDENKFDKPNTFNPYRWDHDLEKSYYTITFSQGPQKCPGKDLVIGLLSCYILKYLELVNYKLNVYPIIDVNNVPQMINPYKFKFS